MPASNGKNGNGKKPPKAKKAAKGAGAPMQVESLKHKEAQRTNIPTRELQALAASHEEQPVTLRYPRDTSLDPQLVWKGKDEQDAGDLEVTAAPIYIQEKVHPQAIIEDIRARASEGKPAPADLFSDFNGLDESVKTDFYQHGQHWSNRLILGDSLLVMASLAEKEKLRGQVQMIYMDPPYGIKFGSNWQVSTRKRDVKDGKKEEVSSEREVIKAFRDTWELGIHSYLKVWRERLTVARDLLAQSGCIFVQIGEENLHLIRCLLDEVFGSENFVSQISFVKTSASTGDYLPSTTDFLLFYAKEHSRLKYRQLYISKIPAEEVQGPYSWLELADGTRRRMSADEKKDLSKLPEGSKIFRIDNLQSQSIGRAKGEGAACCFPVEFEERTWRPIATRRWATNEAGMAKLKAARRLACTTGNLYYVRFLDDFGAYPISNTWADTVIAGFASEKTYVVETSTKVVHRCMLMTTDPGDLVLDPTCGSGTTAYVAEQWGRRWITIDTSRVALALARTRLMTAKFPYYLLADSAAGQRKEAELTGKPVGTTIPSFDIRW